MTIHIFAVARPDVAIQRTKKPGIARLFHSEHECVRPRHPSAIPNLPLFFEIGGSNSTHAAV